MKLDSDYDNDVYKSLVKQTTEYFKAKRTFELKNDENLVTKADSVINNPKTISNVLSNIDANEKRKQLTDDNRINQVNKQPKQKGAKKK
jgi:Na+/phosphate symporter